MLTSEERERIRRAYYIDHKSVRYISIEQGHSRDTINRIIAETPPTSSRRTRRKPAPVFGPFLPRIDVLMEQNERLPQKQRYTAHKIFEVLQSEGYQGCESRVRQYIASWKRVHEASEVFLPLEFEPGQDAQCDWGEAQAVIAGVRQTVQVFVMRLCYSRKTFVMAFPSQKQESFLYGHVQAFNHFGGVPWRSSYDNLATAVKLALDKGKKPDKGRKRTENRTFVAFRSHYLFESHFCTPAAGWEKGQVEHSVGFSRRNFMVPLPEASSFEELNGLLVERCLQDEKRRVSRQPLTIQQAWEQEHPLLRPLPPFPYDCCEMVTVRLTPYSQATFETNRYSVPVSRARREVTLKAYPFQVDIYDKAELLARHPRSYEREQDIFDPLHYLPLLEQRPGAFDYAKPMKQWRKEWPPSYHRILHDLKEKWPEGRGVQEFVRILQLHQEYPAALLEQAIEQALSYGCVHLDGVVHCLHQLTDPQETHASLDLSDRPHLQEVGNQPVDLSRYDKLLKYSW
jgi:transposase